MSACLYCDAPLAAFKAFCDSTCENLFGITSTNECAPCGETYAVVGFTRDGRPVMGCRACGESYEIGTIAGVA